MTTPLDEILRAAGDATRLRILNLLRLGGICVCDLQQVLGLPQPTVSRHLAVLRHARLVTDVRAGNRVMYSLAPADSPALKRLFEFLGDCFAAEPAMQEDVQRMAVALRGGACNSAAEDSAALERIAL